MSLALLELVLDAPGDADAGSTRLVGRTDERAWCAFDELGVAGTSQRLSDAKTKTALSTQNPFSRPLPSHRIHAKDRVEFWIMRRVLLSAAVLWCTIASRTLVAFSSVAIAHDQYEGAGK